jgi:prepilin peptidase CpaA
MTLTIISWLVLGLITAVAAVIDFRTGHIPNPLVASGLVAGSVLHVLGGALELPSAEASGLLFAAWAALEVLVGLVLCAIVPLTLFRIDAMGGGDVKLFAVIGATVGPSLGLEIQLLAFVLLAVYALARLAYEGQLARLLGNTAALVVNPFLGAPRRRQALDAQLSSLRFGPAIFLATLATAAQGGWFS